MSRCLGPLASAVMKGRLMLVEVALDSSIFALLGRFLQALGRHLVLAQVNAVFLWKSSAIQSMMRWSKSSPPRWVSPLVARTSVTPSPSR